MRRFITFSLVGIVLAAASTALAQKTPWVWSPSRAAQMVIADAVVRLPPSERASLEAEIRIARSTYLLAEMVASEEGDWLAAGMYHNLVYRLTNALNKVRSGLGVDKARCTGVSRALKGRFRHLRCSVSSQFVEIPTVARIDHEGDRQIVVEGPSRLVGPLTAQLDVRVTGKSAFAYRQTAT
jgi:hypothetical protein